jgi:hypothetical protein
MICLSYIEGVQQYRDGHPSQGSSKTTFLRSLKRIYPDKFLDDDLNEFYDEARNGLFHNGMIKQAVVYSGGFPAALEFTHDAYRTIKVNQKMLLEDVKKDFVQYIKDISIAGPLQANFNHMFSVV